MSVPKKLVEFVGEWAGINKLYLSWLENKFAKESDSTVVINFAAKRKFINITYTWIYEDEKQEGEILLGYENDLNQMKAVWIDSFHLGDKFMVCDGNIKDDVISIKGFYTVPDNPDWGWKTIIDFHDEKSFKFLMYNVTPEGLKELAVESIYTRQAQSLLDKSLNAVSR